MTSSYWFEVRIGWQGVRVFCSVRQVEESLERLGQGWNGANSGSCPTLGFEAEGFVRLLQGPSRVARLGRGCFEGVTLRVEYICKGEFINDSSLD